MKHLIAVMACVLLATAWQASALGQADDDDAIWAQAPNVVVAKLTGVTPAPGSKPTDGNWILQFTVENTLRGEFKAGQKLSGSHNVGVVLAYPLGKSCLVAASGPSNYLRVDRIAESTPELLARVSASSSTPFGWALEGGKPVSPWASLGAKAWPPDAKDPAAKLVCSKTGRPALYAGDVTFTVEKVPPVKAVGGNPDGDGEFQVTVKNNTDKELSVPALLSADGKILWEESLVIVCQKKAYVCPGCKGVSGKVGPTVLKPHESVSTVVNILRLRGPQWPRGTTMRIEFQFALGEKTKSASFLYVSKYHNPLLDAAQKLP